MFPKSKNSFSVFLFSNKKVKGSLRIEKEGKVLGCWRLRTQVNADGDEDAGGGVSKVEDTAHRAHPADDVLHTHVAVTFVNGLLKVEAAAVVAIGNS